jgi:quinoprotein glucose dehydrogenase
MHGPLPACPLTALWILASSGLLPGQAQEELPAGWSKQLWAAPGQLQNPVAIAFDPWQRLYVAESDRAGNAVQDTRQIEHLDAVLEDLRLATVQDRERLIERWVAAGAFDADYFTRTEDRVRQLSDADGDGSAERSTVFAGGFNAPADGIASGVLWHEGDLFLTNIPHLWRLRDEDGDGAAERREAVSSGYGVRWCFFGHDLHGLSLGPDGRLYFTMGDRGLHVVDREGRTWHHPDTGAVLRCWPDGSSLEVYHLGLRNPQELCWDDFGNLFTGDNNCDSGDQARLVQVFDGADSGWCQDVQSLPSRGPWNREHLWQLLGDFPGLERPSWCLPPIAHVGAGPSGFEAYPGLGGGPELEGRLLLVDFRGSESLVHALRLEPRGAGFALAEDRTFFRGATVTDLAFGYDGRLFLSDWGGGWTPNPRGSVFALVPPEGSLGAAERAALAEVQALCQGRVREQSVERLLELLGHADRRARFAAQHELVRRTGAELEALPGLIADGQRPLLARLHALWAVGSLARRDGTWLEPLVRTLTASEPLLQARAAQALANLFDAPTREQAAQSAAAALTAALGDGDARVNAEAALALGRLGVQAARGALLDLAAALDTVFERDAAARGEAPTAPPRSGPTTSSTADGAAGAPVAAGPGPAARAPGLEGRDLELSQALVRQALAAALEDLSPEASDLERAATSGPGARLALCLALGRIGSPLLAACLDDEEPRIAVEAVRLVYDRAFRHPELKALWPRLAELLGRPLPAGWPAEPVWRRAIEAAQHLGGRRNAELLLEFAARPDLAPAWRRLALERLGEFARPAAREGVWGHLVEPPERSAAELTGLLDLCSARLLDACSGDREAEALASTLLVRFGPPRGPTELLAGVGRLAESPAARLVMFEQLWSASRELRVPAALRVLSRLPMDGDRALRRRALSGLAEEAPAQAEQQALDQLFAARAADRQDAVLLLAGLGRPAADAALRARLSEAQQGRGDPELALELFLAAEALLARSGPPTAIAGQSSSGDGSAAGAEAEASDDSATPPAAKATAHGAASGGALPRSAPRPVPLETLLEGGVAARGRELFLHHGGAECLRCHRLEGLGGVVGPALDGVAGRLSRRELAEALVRPDARIAPGYAAPSAMPAMDGLARPDELRDLVAFLAELKPSPSASASPESLGPRNERHLPWEVLAATGAAALISIGAVAAFSRPARRGERLAP